MTSHIKKLVLHLILLCSWNLSFSQVYIPGNTYYDSTGYIAYIAGNLPILIAAPHGGSSEPSTIPDRMCAGCVTVKDAWTRPIAEGLHDAIVEKTGCYPHVIINGLHRKKLDANRAIIEAANRNAIAEQAWHAYHGFIDMAKAKVAEDYERGLFLDMHGHGKPIQRIELGYLLSGAELQQTDAVLNSRAFLEESSIRTLTEDNVQNHTHAALLRGQNSFGTLLSRKGFPTVPSSTDPFPHSNEPYFSGGYSTQRHGSRDNEGEIDAIQIELNQDIRFNNSSRLVLIQSLAQSAIEYYDLHYNNQFIGNYCNLVVSTSVNKIPPASIFIYPNPATHYFLLKSDLYALEVFIYNTVGQRMVYKKVSFEEKIDISELKSGLYIVQIRKQNSLLQSLKLSVK